MKRIAKWICILSLFIVALYFACVYATGYAIRYGLKNIDRYVKQGLNVESQAKFVNDIFEISYTGEKSSLFTENGFIKLLYEFCCLDVLVGSLGIGDPLTGKPVVVEVYH